MANVHQIGAAPKDNEEGTKHHQQLIDDLYEKTGVTITVEDGKWSASEIDETKGSKTARENLLEAINSDQIIQILDNRGKGNEVPTNPDGTHTNIINFDGYDIQYFIDNTFGMDKTTNGFAMTFMHELQHTNAMGGKEDTNKYGAKGIVVRIVNDMLRELGLNERESYQAMDAGPNQNVFIPYSKEVKKNIEKGIPPRDDQPHIRINKLKAAGGRM